MSEPRKTVVDYKQHGHVAVLTLNDPPANTCTHELMRDLDECILKTRFDTEVQVAEFKGR